MKIKQKIKKMYTRDTELRKLQICEIEKVARFIDGSGKWKDLIGIIRDEDRDNKFLFTSDHVKIVENESRLMKKSESEILLEEWSYIGKKRPTIGTLIDYLVKLDLFRAADYLAIDLLKTDRPERPQSGPGAEVVIDDKTLEALEKKRAQIKRLQDVMSTFMYQGSTALVISGHQGGSSRRSAQNKTTATVGDPEVSDLMKFSQSRDLIEFSTKKIPEEKPEDCGDCANDDFVLQAAESQDIPFLVNRRGKLSSEDDVEEVHENSVVHTESSRNSESDYITDASRLSENNSTMDTFDFDGQIPVTVVKHETNAQSLDQAGNEQLELRDDDGVKRVGTEKEEQEDGEQLEQGDVETIEQSDAEKLEQRDTEKLEQSDAEKLEQSDAEKLEQKDAEKLEQKDVEKLEQSVVEKLEQKDAEKLEQSDAEKLEQKDVEKLKQEDKQES